MGDTVEITTDSSVVNKKLETFYKTTANSFAVRVKSASAVYIRLTETPNSQIEPFYEIHIGCNNNTLSNIKKNKNGNIIATANTTNILSDISHRGFCLRFHNKKICVYRETAATPFLECTDETMPSLRFISFGSSGQNWERRRGQFELPTAHWTFEVPPYISEPVLSPLKDGAMRWESLVDGKLPPDAFIAEIDKHPIYVARAKHNGHLTPGMYVEGSPHAVIGWFELPRLQEEFEVLCGYNASWLPSSDDKPVPPNAIPAGYENGCPQFIVRAWFDGHPRVGKKQQQYNKSWAVYKGREIQAHTYEILVKQRPTTDDAFSVKINHKELQHY